MKRLKANSWKKIQRRIMKKMRQRKAARKTIATATTTITATTIIIMTTATMISEQRLLKQKPAIVIGKQSFWPAINNNRIVFSTFIIVLIVFNYNQIKLFYAWVNISTTSDFAVARSAIWIWWNCFACSAIAGSMTAASPTSSANWCHKSPTMSLSARIVLPLDSRTSAAIKLVRPNIFLPHKYFRIKLNPYFRIIINDHKTLRC